MQAAPQAAATRTVAILHLSEVSGPSTTLRAHLDRLAALGPVELVVPPGRSGAAGQYERVAHVTTLDYEPLLAPRGAGGIIRAARAGARQTRAFRALLRRLRPSLVVIATVTLPSALLAARLERVPAIVVVTEIVDDRCARTLVRRGASRVLLRLHHALAAALVCCSRAVAAQFPEHGRARVRTIYPGIPASDATGNGQAFRESLDLVDAWPLMATVGNITRGRAQDLSIRALALLRNRFPRAALVIVGSPHERRADLAYRSELGELARELGVDARVAYPGFVDRTEDVYAAADAVVNPVRVSEAFGQVGPEALVAGCPVVATRVGAIPEVLRDERDALLVEPDDAAGIAAAVARLATEPGLAERLVEEGRARVMAEFAEGRSVEAFAEVVGDVTGVHPPAYPATSGTDSERP